jgi:hypothetical protein
VVSTLAPIEAWPAKNSPAAGFRSQLRTEGRQKFCASIRHFAAFLGEDDISLDNERVGDGDSQPAREVVVSRPCKAQPVFLL